MRISLLPVFFLSLPLAADQPVSSPTPTISLETRAAYAEAANQVAEEQKIFDSLPQQFRDALLRSLQAQAKAGQSAQAALAKAASECGPAHQPALESGQLKCAPKPIMGESSKETNKK